MAETTWRPFSVARPLTIGAASFPVAVLCALENAEQQRWSAPTGCPRHSLPTCGSQRRQYLQASDTESGKLPPVANYCHMAHETQNIYYLALCGKHLPVPEQNSLVAHMMDSHGRERDVSCPDIPSQTAAEQRLQEWFSYLYVISAFFLRYDPASRVGGFLAFREYKSVHFL